jgi:hypothetical protein
MIPYFPPNPMLAKITSKNQLTLPKSVTQAVGATDYFDVEARAGQIILTPVRIQRGDAVRAKLAELNLTDADMSDAVAWARAPQLAPAMAGEPAVPWLWPLLSLQAGMDDNVGFVVLHEPAMDLSRFPRRCYTPFATPLEPMPRFSAALAASCPGGGPEVWIKRDDMLGLFPGGNKTRKLEFLVADALAQGADTLVTCGAPQSNHCRITLAAAVKEGLKCRFVIEERVPGSYSTDASGNNFMFRLMGVEAITVVPAGSNMAQAMQQVADDLAAQGRKGYIIPGGGSNALGGLGYVACAQELQQQLFDQGVRSTAWWWARAARARTAAAGRLPGQPHPHPDRGHRRQPRPGRPGAAGAQGGAGRHATCWACQHDRCRARRW